MEKYYKILEIHTNATEQEVTQAYRDMVKVWHPDRFPNDIRLQKRADRKLKEINNAYERIVEHLKNPHKQQQSQQYERTEKQEEQAAQPPPRQTKPNKSRRFYMKYWGLFLVIGSILLAKFMGHFMLGLIRNTGIFTNNQSNSGEQFGLSVIRQNRNDKEADSGDSINPKSVGIQTGMLGLDNDMPNNTLSLPRKSKLGLVDDLPPPGKLPITLRSKPTEGYLTKHEVKSMLQRYNFYCRECDWSKEYCNPKGAGIQNNYKKQSRNGVEVVADHACGLMWQQSGSDEYMGYENAKKYVGQLNHGKFAGYSDWRLPTLEEAMSLMEPTEMNGYLYIDPIFDRKQLWIWTSDKYSASSAWVVGFDVGGCYSSEFGKDGNAVRAVR